MNPQNGVTFLLLKTKIKEKKKKRERERKFYYLNAKSMFVLRTSLSDSMGRQRRPDMWSFEVYHCFGPLCLVLLLPSLYAFLP